MLNKTLAFSALALSLIAPFTSAYSIVETENVKGVVSHIDVDARELVVELDSGKNISLELSSIARVVKEGVRTENLAVIEKGDVIEYRKESYKEVSDVLEGTIVAVDSKNYTARIRLASSAKIVTVKFDSRVAVYSEKENLAFNDLRRGFEVRVSYPSAHASINY